VQDNRHKPQSILEKGKNKKRNSRSVDWGRLVNQCDMRHFMGNAHTIALAELLHFYLINFDQINLDSFYVEIINIDANTHYYESEFFWAKKLGRKKNVALKKVKKDWPKAPNRLLYGHIHLVQWLLV
jgi:hypothetical protein